MRRTRFPILSPVLLGTMPWLATVQAADTPESGSRPNILVILADDLGETTNVAGQHPDIVQEMTALLQRVREQGRSRP